MVRKILIVLALIALAAGLVFGIVHGYESWRMKQVEEGKTLGRAEVQKLWDKDKIARDAAQAVAVAKAVKEEHDKAAAAAQGEKDARDRAEARARANAVAADRARTAAGGLSGHLADLDTAARSLGIPDAAACPGLFAQQRDAAIQARSLFGSCVSEYRDLGQAADGDAAATQLQLDTALSYIKATGAPGADQIVLPASTP